MEEVGRFQLGEWRARGPGWGDEKLAKEFVSFVDVESERRLARALRALCPEAGFYGEETEQSIGPGLTWVVDPVDGTTNYLSGLDWFCISVALFRSDSPISGDASPEGGRPILGIVHRPATGEWWWSGRGLGAYHRVGARPDGFDVSGPDVLSPVGPCPLAQALVCTGTPFRSPDTVGAFMTAAADVLVAARDLRRLGSAALDLCNVASGWLQAFWEVDLQPYDVGAALLLLEETGCEITTIGGARYDPFSSRSLVTGLPGATAELRKLVAARYGELRD
jgi:myo-inositol-1(or 4)-monophosphatase